MSLYRLGNRTPNVPPSGSAWVAPNATVIGDVTLGEEASVWFNAVIRGDNDPITIGDRTNIQDGSVLHSDEGLPLKIGSDVTVGHMAMVHSCTIGDNCLIGIGAVILGRAVIGANSIVGAGALITEGKVFPEGVLIVGSPAKVVRELTPEQIGFLKLSAAHYVENARRYRGDLERISD
ncbi:MAG: gamma carbonic anhydrase family protein [Asticcacaulis sp.]